MSFLVLTLAVRVELESDNAAEDINEMTILCRELLNSDISASPPTDPFMALALAVSARLDIGEAGQVIECLREEAKIRWSQLHDLSWACQFSHLSLLRNPFD
jgi:hypothetical protein